MNQNLLYKIDKAVKQKNNPEEIAKICREYLLKFPKNLRVINILNNLKLEKEEIFSKSIIELNDYIQTNQLQKAYDLGIELLKNNDNNSNLFTIIGDILKKSNHFLEALDYYIKAFQNDNDYERVNSKLYNFLMTTNASEYLQQWAKGFEVLLSNKKDLGHSKLNLISNKGINYFKLNPFFKKLSKYSSNDFSNSFLSELKDKKELSIIKTSIEEISRNKLFLLCIEECQVSDIDTEKLLTFIRKFILLNINDVKFTDKIYNLIESLALNSFFNDYIFYITEEETILVNSIESNIKIDKEKITAEVITKILILGMYKNLSNSAFIKNLRNNRLSTKYFNYTFYNPLKEKQFVKSVKKFGDIKNCVSFKVKKQYESFPYPQWIYSDTYKQKTNLKNYINSLGLKVYSDEIYSNNNKSFLIAGCGTGKEAYEYNELLTDVSITAIDLSEKSLGYAIRKCNEHDQHNIDFLNGDILNLGKINKKFDIIISNGVIHHMENPNKGCEILNKCLNKNGLLKLSLYSKTARKYLFKFQENAKLENNNTHEGLRNYRYNIITNKNFHTEPIQNWGDFYNTSTFKDLVLHEQEYTYTILQIKDMLYNFNLKFCGFQNIKGLHSKFIQEFRSSENLYNLDYWQEFEEKYPETFSRMYQFWCQKI